MIKLVWRTDVHMSETAPASRKDDWADTVLGKLKQVGLVAARVGADAVLDGGDFFHVKSPTRNSHDLIRRVAELHASYPCPVYANVGNHDCVYGDYAYINQQPLGVLFATRVFERCYDEHEVYFGPACTTGTQTRACRFNRKDGKWLDGNPFEIKNPDVPIVRVVGIPYHGTTYDHTRFRDIKKGDEDFLICMAHVLASPTGGSMFEGEDIIKYASLVDLEPSTWLFGHWHKDQGVVEVGDKTIVNIGSLTRGSLSQDDATRRPACAVLSFERGQKVQVQVVRLKVGAVAEVFDVEGRNRAEARSTTMDSFAESLKKKLVKADGQTLEEIVGSMVEVPVQVKERVLNYLERAGVQT